MTTTFAEPAVAVVTTGLDKAVDLAREEDGGPPRA
jgi:hypothetical protein